MYPLLPPGLKPELLQMLKMLFQQASALVLQVVKVFIVLTPQFLSRDKDQLTKELQQHVKSVTVSCKSPRKVSEGRWKGSGAPEQLPVEFILELLKTVTGKIKQGELRKRSLGDHQGATRGSEKQGAEKAQPGDERSTYCPLLTHLWRAQVHLYAHNKRILSFPGIKMGLKGFSMSWRSTEAKVVADIQKMMKKVNSHCEISGQRKAEEE
ncbi:nuclear pore complex-interacting protein family member A2-like [Macaca fascicularis]|uniref:nuclear pore complex-interacting protein family member A2-like n=1 Tax=Macaca fascicularis TaxID=9541 RepID=UPI0032B0846A